MDSIRIRGGQRLIGKIPISGAKNAALPLMAASLLSDQPLVLSNLPHLADIASMATLLAQHGVKIALDGGGGRGSADGQVISLYAGDVHNTTAPYELVRKMRASVLVLGPLLARHGHARVSQPGGCAIGTRPIDFHLKGLAQLGAEIELAEGYIEARAPHGLVGAAIVLPQPSVGATENLLMAAVLARGETQLVNAAREPEIVDLATCLTAMGAKIEGAGTATITITGVPNLSGTKHTILSDRIEAGTYAIAAAMTGGDVELINAVAAHNLALIDALRATGIIIEETPNGLRIAAGAKPIGSVDVETRGFPGFPTDLQAQFMALMSIGDGASIITETIFENRFMHVPELNRLGSNVTIQNGSALVRGVAELTGAEVMATDLRASVCLVLAGLAALGETIIHRVYHLDRGYERLEDKLRNCGAVIERIRD